MGAAFDAYFANNPNRTEVKQKFDYIQEIDRHENGHCYSGGIGMASGIRFLNDRTFSCINEAEEWVVNNAEKWGPALAVRVKNDEYDGWFFGAWCAS